VRRKAFLGFCYNVALCSASHAPSSIHFQSANYPKVPRSLRGTWPSTPLDFRTGLLCCTPVLSSARSANFGLLLLTRLKRQKKTSERADKANGSRCHPKSRAVLGRMKNNRPWSFNAKLAVAHLPKSICSDTTRHVSCTSTQIRGALSRLLGNLVSGAHAWAEPALAHSKSSVPSEVLLHHPMFERASCAPNMLHEDLFALFKRVIYVRLHLDFYGRMRWDQTLARRFNRAG